MLGLIWAESTDRFIGRDGALPWHLPEDLARFRRITTGHPVVMGRRTWESLPATARPLPGRTNIVLTRRPELLFPGAVAARDVGHALSLVDGDAWVIGGRDVLEAFAPLATRAEITIVDVKVGDGTPAPDLPALDRWEATANDPGTGWSESTTGLRYRHLSLRRRRPITPPRNLT